jgi:competence protein ComFB
MLISSAPRSDQAADLDTIHNYYEHMVLEEIQRQLSNSPFDTGLFADIACVALNHLPPRYIRYDVDMAFYLSPKESIEMEEKVAAAVREAIQFVEQRGSRDA